MDMLGSHGQFSPSLCLLGDDIIYTLANARPADRNHAQSEMTGFYRMFIFRVISVYS
eukprot:COSAG05_NODE_2299_length_3258_cov_2.988382_2_plen_57_part_00